MLFHDDIMAERQAKPGAFAGRLGREEGVEHLLPHARPNAYPVVLPGPVSQPVLDLVELSSCERVAPGGPSPILIVAMEHSVPCLSVGRALRHPGVVVPTLIVEVVVVVGQSRPNHLVDRVGNSVEARFTFAETFAILYVNTDTNPLANATVFIVYGNASCLMPQIFSVPSPNAILRFVCRLCINRGLPGNLRAVTIIGMKRVEPTPPSHFIDRLSCERTPFRHVNNLAVSCSVPNQRG